MILSRTMREADYPELVPEGGILMSMQNVTNMWHRSLERNCLWEYALALKATREVFGDRTDLVVADYGYDLGLPPLLLWMGYDVKLVEIWRRLPEEEGYILEHMLRVKEKRTVCSRDKVDIIPRKMGSENGLPERNSLDAVYCTSILAKLGNVELAFQDICHLVKPGGLLFLTTSEEDREMPIRQFGPIMYSKFIWIAREQGLELVGDESDYDWEHRENSFASLVLKKEIG